MRKEQDDCRAAGFDAMVLHNEAARGAGDCGGRAWRDTDRAGEPARGIFQLDEEHPRLDAIATTVVGTPDSGVVLQGEQAHHSGARSAGEVRDVRVGEFRARPRRFGYVVQFGAVAVFDAWVA